MAKDKAQTPGQELEEQLLQAIHAADQVPLPGARDLPVLTGVDRKGDFLQPQENVLVKAADILVKSGRVFTFGDNVVALVGDPESPEARLVPLRTGAKVEPGARGVLANEFVCQNGPRQFPPPPWLLEVLLHARPVLEKLPRIQHHARRPVFNADFVLYTPGWHPEDGVLVLGPEVEPVTDWEGAEAGAPAVERLPPHLRTLLREFCFRSDADVANAVAMLLTGLLANHFVVVTKAVFLIDGNQPGLGKTLLVRVEGVVLDDVDPRLIHYSADDEELQKRICATLRGGRQSVVLIDNAKVMGGAVVSSPAIEANSMAPEVSLRILSKSENYTRPNDLLWALTMNDTRTSPDLVSRGSPVRLMYEGEPKDRTFTGPEPIAYAREHRLDILGELAGMVERWNLAGRPPGHRSHRCHQWAQVIGGILETVGLAEFLENVGEAATTFDSALDELAALAEAVINGKGPYLAGEGHDEEE